MTLNFESSVLKTVKYAQYQLQLIFTYLFHSCRIKFPSTPSFTNFLPVSWQLHRTENLIELRAEKKQAKTRQKHSVINPRILAWQRTIFQTIIDFYNALMNRNFGRIKKRFHWESHQHTKGNRNRLPQQMFFIPEIDLYSKYLTCVRCSNTSTSFSACSSSFIFVLFHHSGADATYKLTVLTRSRICHRR